MIELPGVSPEVPDEDRPVAGYAAFIATYTTFLGSVVLAFDRGGRPLPNPGAADIALLGFATHKASRLLTREKVARPLRAPFTEVEGKGELPRELDEAPRDAAGPLRRAAAELLVCPYCLSQWIATTLVLGLALAPRLTRFIAGILAIVAVADFLQPVYRLVEKGAD